jgi:hypothetical protein
MIITAVRVKKNLPSKANLYRDVVCIGHTVKLIGSMYAFQGQIIHVISDPGKRKGVWQAVGRGEGGWFWEDEWLDFHDYANEEDV